MLSKVASTAAAPAVKVRERDGGCVAIAFVELAVVPITCLSDSPASARALLLGLLFVFDLEKGELEGVCLAAQTELFILD